MRIAELLNTFGWSHSRGKTFAACRRRYWFVYYGAWGGWDADAPEPARKAYLLKQMTAIPLLLGNTVHATIKAVIQAGGLAGFRGDPVEHARAIMNKVYAESKDRMWERASPKWHPPLSEHYYGPEPSREKLAEAKNKLIACVEAFVGSETLAEVTAAGSDAVLAADQIDAVPIGGIQCFAAPDLAFRRGGEVWVVDWKTGAARAEDAEQVRLYAAYAREKWGVGADDLRAFRVMLPSGERIEDPIDEAALDAAVAAVQAGAEEILALLDDRAGNVARKEAFAPTTDARTCRYCDFRAICDEKAVEAG